MRIFYLPVLTALVSLGCTKSLPKFDSLGSDGIPQPMFNGSTETTVAAGSSNETFAISGDCDPKIRDISGTAVGTASIFNTLAALSSTAVTIECGTTGHFSFTLKSLSDLGFSPISGQTYDVQLRAITSGGISNPSVIHIAYSTANGPDPKRILLTSGASSGASGSPLATGANFKGQIRVTNRVNNYAPAAQGTADGMTLKSGATHSMRAGLASQAN